MASRAPANRQSRLTHTPSFSRADRRAQPGQIRAGQLGTTKSSPHFFAKDLLLLLALALSLRRMLVRYLRMGLSVASVLLGSRVIAFGMMLGSGPMRLGSLIMLFSRLFMHFLWHEIAPFGLSLSKIMTEETCSGLLPTVGVPGDALRVALTLRLRVCGDYHWALMVVAARLLF
jgi:hypothetical protein